MGCEKTDPSVRPQAGHGKPNKIAIGQTE